MKLLRIFLVLGLFLLLPGNTSAGRTTITHTSFTCSSTATAANALAANISRNFLILQNDDATTDIYIKFGVVAVANEGIRLSKVGGSLLLDVTFATSSVSCVTTSATAKLLITSGVGP